MAAQRKASEGENYGVFKAIDDAYRKGDLYALVVARGDPVEFPNSVHPGI
jgi:hypothetical protein